MMWGRVSRAAVMAAVLAGAPLIACAQGGSPAGVTRGTAGTAASTPPAAGASSGPAAGESLPNSGGQATEGGWLSPCPQGPPYISQPCIPAKR